MAALKTVGVVGCGLMGSGIAQVSAQAGLTTWVREVDKPTLDRGLGRIKKFLEDGVAKGKVTAEDRDKVLGNIKGTTDLKDLAPCELVIEAVVESIEAKREVFQALDKIVGGSAVLASNTSSLSITEIAATTGKPERVLGLHFFNPVPLMKLVEIIRALPTNDAAFEPGQGLCRDGRQDRRGGEGHAWLCRESAARALFARRGPHLRIGRRIERGYRQRHETGLWVSDGTADASGFCGA